MVRGHAPCTSLHDKSLVVLDLVGMGLCDRRAGCSASQPPDWQYCQLIGAFSERLRMHSASTFTGRSSRLQKSVSCVTIELIDVHFGVSENLSSRGGAQ